MNIPIYRRYQWQFIWRSWRKALLLMLGAGALLLLIYLAEAYLQEHNQRMDAELNHASLILDVHRLSTFGAPGYTNTDWSEGTNILHVKRL